MDSLIVLFALAVPCLLAELALSARRDLALFDRRDTVANLLVGAGGLLAGAVGRVIALPISWWLFEHRMFDLPAGTWTWIGLLLAHDACFYAFHRASHRVRVLWAAHVPHHSSAHYNLTTALRLSWTTPFTGIPFWWPLPLLGFDPLWILGAHAFSLGYQFCLHTQLVGRLGPLEWVLNTPSHHRVHHGCDREYVDKNFGGVLIVWDRLFGTFAAETKAPTYGLVHPLRSHRVITIAFAEWRAVWIAVPRRGLSVRQRVSALVAHPATMPASTPAAVAGGCDSVRILPADNPICIGSITAPPDGRIGHSFSAATVGSAR
jgi:sterol desaturase/sphingolipid hydroxylase (fatty acid hydroxylase superfamily)